MDNRDKKLEGMLGLAMRAGSLRCGTQPVDMALTRGEVKILILDGAISDNSLQKYVKRCEDAGICVIITSFDMGRAIGRPGKMAAALVDDRFYKALIALTV